MTTKTRQNKKTQNPNIAFPREADELGWEDPYIVWKGGMDLFL